MITQHEIWRILESGLSTKDWADIGEIYAMIEKQADVSVVDPPAKWKRNVRNVLQRKKSSGEILWNGSRGYRRASPRESTA